MSLYFKQSNVTHLIKSFSREEWYGIDFNKKTCTCPIFKGGKNKYGGCKHLHAMGLYTSKQYTHSTTPTFSQALSGLVKSLRLRQVEEAVYWLYYLWNVPDKQKRFRIARRLLIGTSEDGHSIPVMESCVDNLYKLLKLETDFIYYVAEVVRICRFPNWWHSDSGGPDYIYHNLVGHRLLQYTKWDKQTQTVKNGLEKAIQEQDKSMALGWSLVFDGAEDKISHEQQALYIMELAKQANHGLAERLCQVHLKAKWALGGDNNFICQAVWMLAGGQSPVAEKEEPVLAGECYDLIHQMEESWKTPHVLPGWCADGVHCAGDDIRFAGLFPSMWAVCKAFQHYGRVDPQDKWLESFLEFDGLQIKKA